MNYPVMAHDHRAPLNKNEKVWGWFRQKRERLRYKEPQTVFGPIYVFVWWSLGIAGLLELLVIGAIWLLAFPFRKLWKGFTFIVSIIAV